MSMSSETPGGILSGHEIIAACAREQIVIQPFNSEHVNPASYDLTLGKGVAVYCHWACLIGSADDGSSLHAREETFDVRREPKVMRFNIGPKGIVLKPGIGYLMHTEERVVAHGLVAVIDGKSSIGRLFMKVHETAGYVDSGFDGQYTLEVTVVHPLRIFAGMRIAQVRFHTLVGREQSYAGNYVGNAALGAVPSRAHLQFKERPHMDGCAPGEVAATGDQIERAMVETEIKIAIRERASKVVR
jgi:dCTP deaminase